MNNNYNKLELGKILSSYDGDCHNHGDCFNYGSVSGCDNECPVLNVGKCENYMATIQKLYAQGENVSEYLDLYNCTKEERQDYE